jgi:BlaI family transcriptional regulator, penicillinase repressor
MTERKPPRPTDAELEILRILWEHGASTVRKVHDVISRSRDAGYTTILKQLQIMAEKGLVDRDESNRSHVYTPRYKEEQTQKQLVRDLLARAFGGSTEKLVMQALSETRATPAELEEIRKLLAVKKKMGRGGVGERGSGGE